MQPQDIVICGKVDCRNFGIHTQIYRNDSDRCTIDMLTYPHKTIDHQLKENLPVLKDYRRLSST